ncbi:hypothetical protein [Deinococcus arcticus]|uniref:Uncharacterized protein n=1 Tax=Deinococcus arcticus TaxID=2136176 RepID=A0A2T3W7I3_9DEIO|nr:hypothetical protein [Deinococcus arcticus]PTA67870.1 hypothetical protein C8263_10715 [Deinococcus arcticus]
MSDVILRYFLIGVRPVKHIGLKDSIYLSAAYALDWQTGTFISHDDYLDNIYGRPSKDEAEEISQEEFDTLVQEYRREKGFLHFDDSAFKEGLRYYREVLAQD